MIRYRPRRALANLKVLYGTGHYFMTGPGETTRAKGVRYTIKGGVIYDSAKALADVRAMVTLAKAGMQE